MVLILLTLLSFGTPALAFNQIVAFGDSLSDNGNLYTATSGLIPDSGQYKDGRYSNGPVWVEYLAQELQLSGRLNNNAYGGVETGADPFPPGLKTQVSLFTGSSPIDPNALFTVWIGANDLLRGDSDHQAVVDNIEDALNSLMAAGARRFLVLNLPDLGAIPTATTESASKTAVTRNFNSALITMMNTLQTANPEIILYALDIYALFGNLVAAPGDYGFSNAGDVCPSFYIPHDFENTGPYVFWDEIHPTTEAHELIGAIAANEVFSGCTTIYSNLDLSIPCADYNRSRVGFTLRHVGSIAENPTDLYWKLEASSLRESSLTGSDCATVGADLNISVSCGEYFDSRFAFILEYVDGTTADSEGHYWKLIISSLTAK